MPRYPVGVAHELFALTCGWLTGPAGIFLAGERGRLTVPIPSYLVVHPRGNVLFDTGLHPDVQHDPAGRLKAAAQFFTPRYAAGEDAAARLGALGLAARDVRWVVNSHLHFDHAGGNACFPGAALVVQRREWDAGHDPAAIAAHHYDPADYDTGQEVMLIDGEHDLFGDGSVVCVPTFGHTPGHQSLRVRLASSDVVLTGDACYLRRTLESLHLPPVVADREAMLASLRMLRTLQAGGARIFYGHDAEFWSSVPQAPQPIV